MSKSGSRHEAREPLLLICAPSNIRSPSWGVGFLGPSDYGRSGERGRLVHEVKSKAVDGKVPFAGSRLSEGR